MLCDLHIHSWYSTGNQSPEEIIREALSKGIRFISITDDDTTKAYKELDELAARYHISYIRGLQVVASYKSSFFRLMAYGFDPENVRLQDLLERNQTLWDELGKKVIEVLAKDYPELSVKEYSGFRKDPKHGGFKYNSYLFHKDLDGGYEASTKMLLQYREKFLEIMKSLALRPLKEAIEIIHNAGGKVIIPGGYLRNAETFTTDLEDLVALGADGVEGFSPNYPDEMAQAARDYARKHGLILTGGGDGHGTWASREKFAIGIQEVDSRELFLGDISIYE